ncbi:MAG: RNA polymerase sigma-70 factor [Tannerella sp.]|jgi:RNA polymerase sigma-70 factor (ECF subfamily)|nr:RNA polymerase sigma-70 factor [Tannerella sp.]
MKKKYYFWRKSYLIAMDNTEQKLLTQIKAGNENAFKKLFYLHGDKLYLWAFKLIGNASAAEDLVQDFFVRYWEKREILSFFPSFSAYAYKSIYNASLNYLRDNERFVHGYEITIDLVDTDVEEEDLYELQRLLQKAINELPERCKKIFVMATLEKKKYSEVADQLGISVNTVKVQVSKAYRLLKEKIG